ncbi:hypothetical protein TELCIR_22695 [Teladorsagia circumcincta]|uniref:SCP domain-containing protein n=1 Tax=Teladorsagia circumcincta TaxID=45464 RepID=A0A2G9TD75_TELCI|nr:hypothetical protein TELCIR_22695 [Teladorsagia circumcincta]
MYQWTMPGEYYEMNQRVFDDDRLYTFANMAYQDIYEVGCNYEQCVDENNDVVDAAVACIYNKKVPEGATLYELGDTNGCENTPDVCTVPNAKCEGLLCEVPRDTPSFL